MNTEEEVPEKSQIHREHMERVGKQKAAEEEALKLSRVVRGIDKKKYKNVKYVHSKREVPDRVKLMIMRRYQFLIGLMGSIGVGIIIWSIYDPRLQLWISENFFIEIDLILLGCALALAGIVGLIGFQHGHDRISDRIHAKHA
jgi:hypothetical protein